MAKYTIQQLEDESGNGILPVTVEEAVKDREGLSLAAKLQTIIAAIGDKEDKTGVVNVAESTLTQEMVNNTIYNAGVLTALTITFPSTIGVDYISQVNFTSCENDQQTGNSTQFNPPQPPAPAINMDGDDINQQKFEFILHDGNKVKAKTRFTMLNGYAPIDLGIAKCHFEIGAGKENFEWQ